MAPEQAELCSFFGGVNDLKSHDLRIYCESGAFLSAAT
jgi:hypothetical protein